MQSADCQPFLCSFVEHERRGMQANSRKMDLTSLAAQKLGDILIRCWPEQKLGYVFLNGFLEGISRSFSIFEPQSLKLPSILSTIHCHLLWTMTSQHFVRQGVSKTDFSRINFQEKPVPNLDPVPTELLEESFGNPERQLSQGRKRSQKKVWPRKAVSSFFQNRRNSEYTFTTRTGQAVKFNAF